MPLDEGGHFADTVSSASRSVELLETLWREVVPPGFTVEGAEEAFSESRGRAYLADVKEAIARQVRATASALPLSPPTLPILPSTITRSFSHMVDQPAISDLLPANYAPTTSRARTAPSSRGQTRPGTPRDDTETFPLPVDVDNHIDVDVDTYEWREDRARDRLHHPSTRPGSASGSLDGNNINARVVEEGTALDGMASLAEKAKGVSYLGQPRLPLSRWLSRLLGCIAHHDDGSRIRSLVRRDIPQCHSPTVAGSAQ